MIELTLHIIYHHCPLTLWKTFGDGFHQKMAFFWKISYGQYGWHDYFDRAPSDSEDLERPVPKKSKLFLWELAHKVLYLSFSKLVLVMQNKPWISWSHLFSSSHFLEQNSFIFGWYFTPPWDIRDLLSTIWINHPLRDTKAFIWLHIMRAIFFRVLWNKWNAFFWRRKTLQSYVTMLSFCLSLGVNIMLTLHL